MTNAFVDGIRDAELRMAVKINGKKASHEALAFALSIEAVKTSIQNSSWVKRTEIQEEDQSQLIRKIAEQVNSLSKQQTNSRSPEEDRRPRCFRCNRPGHMQRDCRTILDRSKLQNWRKSQKSGKLEAADFRGRESYLRFKNAPIITTSTIIFPVTTIGKGSSLEVKGKIGKREHSFVVDTGTSRSIIQAQLVNNDQVFLKDKYKLRTATGELVPVKGTSNISFELGGKPFVHEFLVASITDECILGIDFMRQHEISLNMKGGVFVCSRNHS